MGPVWFALAFAAVSAVAISRARAWPFELFAHFRPHLIVAGAVLSAVMLAWDMAAAALAVAATIANLATFPKLKYRVAEPQSDAGLCVLWANLWKSDAALRRTLIYARQKNADVLLFAEFPDADAAWVSVNAADYPHVLISEVSQARFTSRVAVLSRHAFEHSETMTSPPLQQRAFQTVSIRCGGKALQISAAHPAAPGTPQMLRDRDAAMAMIFERLVDPALVGGDFNAAPWCPSLYSAPPRIGNPFAESTWLTRWPLIGLPIDHLFVTASVRVSAYEVGPFLGSDHRALLARVHI
ncbi:MAG: endonuclease/exonuclease/phosphatase family protein [Hyphomonadaceae bacterium]